MLLQSMTMIYTYYMLKDRILVDCLVGLCTSISYSAYTDRNIVGYITMIITKIPVEEFNRMNIAGDPL